MRIKVLANPKKPWSKTLARELKDFLRPKHRIVRTRADATVCIGGDGTILYNCHKGRLQGSVVGIGGDKSYICQLHRSEWRDKINDMLESDRAVKVFTLECELAGRRYVALNDIVIHATHYRVAEIGVEAAGRKKSFEGDGIIISTALGSAAYAYSAGGEKLAPTEKKISLVPICPYRREFSPMVLSESAAVSVKVGSDCAFIPDGIFVRRLKKGERIIARKGPAVLFFEGIGKSF